MCDVGVMCDVRVMCGLCEVMCDEWVMSDV